MKYTKVLITGSNSYIASKVLPELNFGEISVYLAARSEIADKSLLPYQGGTPIKLINYEDEKVIDQLTEKIHLDNSDCLLILNFIGNFGTLSCISEIRADLFVDEVKSNLIPLITLSKLIGKSGPGSLMLTFSGAGIGGENLDMSSPSYLAAKAAMAFLVEAFDNELKSGNRRIGAISPGAFASKMQNVVANAKPSRSISPERIQSAKRIMKQDSNPSKLTSLVKFLIESPEMAGGRIWSANYDDIHMKEISDGFGKLRRQT